MEDIFKTTKWICFNGLDIPPNTKCVLIGNRSKGQFVTGKIICIDRDTVFDDILENYTDHCDNCIDDDCLCDDCVDEINFRVDGIEDSILNEVFTTYLEDVQFEIIPKKKTSSKTLLEEYLSKNKEETIEIKPNLCKLLKERVTSLLRGARTLFEQIIFKPWHIILYKIRQRKRIKNEEKAMAWRVIPVDPKNGAFFTLTFFDKYYNRI